MGHSLAPVLLSGECLAALLGIWKGRREGQDRRGSSPAFLVVTGAAAMLTYVAIRRGSGCLSHLRYVLLALLLPVGLVAGAFVRRPSWQRVAAASSPTSISGPE